MRDFSELKKNLKKDFSGLKGVKVAVLGDSATQLLSLGIRAAGYECGLNIDLWEADYDQIERQIVDSNSELYSFEPEVVIVFHSTQKLLTKYNKLGHENQVDLAENELELIKGLSTQIRENLQAKLIHYNYSETDDSVFGSFANQTPASFLFQLRKLNYQLMEFAQETPDFYICDLSSVQNLFGKQTFFSPSLYVNSSMTISLDCIPSVAFKTVQIISAFQGKFRKCLIVDLDNTLWGGVIGDDGIENLQIGDLGIGKAFTEFQYWIKKLKNRGVIIAVCSKNSEDVAKEAFEKHPDMVLSLADISVFVANWENKADNIRYIQQVLNIGFDSMVFLDDNPMERDIIRKNIPGITVPELPEDPAEYLEYLYGLNLFETVSFSKEDTERTMLYQNEEKRIAVQSQFTDIESYLKSLNMLAKSEPFDKFNAPRVAQLTQRSNQFNLRTKRYTEAEIIGMTQNDTFHTFAFSLDDRFGSNGLISVVILKRENPETFFIDTWLMSCRVLKRGMEDFVLNTLVEYVGSFGGKKLIGEYIPTPKNELVKNHYIDLGFSKSEEYFVLDITTHQPRKNYIQSAKNK